MRKGYDCLNGLVRNEFKKDPLLGDVFIFLSRGRNKIKIVALARRWFLHFFQAIGERDF
ncbi:MAG: IS66 family insertion sequence element accessory protein TnpB [Bacteroidetes bacterium]|nr:IS66 family insertion sequence element accessory protein TnpB [Bacteroidota bacterium]